MAEIRRILSVVDPTVDAQPVVQRAAWLAESVGADLELFICDYDQYLAGERFFDSAALEKARANLIEGHRAKLRELAQSIGSDRVTISTDATWDYPLHEGIVRKATQSNADLVIKDTHYHTIIKRSIFSNTDWALIRTCPVPLWLVKQREFRDHPTVIAAVDPVHERDKPAALDHEILAYAKLLTTKTNGTLQVFHGFDPSPAYAVSADSLAFPISVPINEMTEALRRQHCDAMDEFLATEEIDKSKVQVLEGETRELLVGLAEKHSADCVVIGAVSRGALQRLLLGSTAEQLLDHVPCDLLIVKPKTGAETQAG